MPIRNEVSQKKSAGEGTRLELEGVSFNQMTKELHKEIADVKKTLNDIIVSLQSANDKITRISEAIATSASNIGDSNMENGNNIKRGKNNSSSKSSRKSSFSSDESSGESDGNSRKRRRKRRQMSGKNDLRGKNVFDSNTKNFISKNSRDNNNIDNSHNQTDTNFHNANEKIKDLEEQCAVLQLQIQS